MIKCTRKSLRTLVCSSLDLDRQRIYMSVVQVRGEISATMHSAESLSPCVYVYIRTFFGSNYFLRLHFILKLKRKHKHTCSTVD